MEQAEEQNANVGYTNQGYNTAGIIQIRLNTEPIINQIELCLKGKTQNLKEDSDGNIQIETVKIGSPIMNDEGVQSVINYTQTVVNSQTVQGNLTYEHFEFLICQIRKEIAFIVALNYPSWSMKIENCDFVVNTVCNLVELFLSRAIDNEERLSYAATIKTQEKAVLQQSKNFGMLK